MKRNSFKITLIIASSFLVFSIFLYLCWGSYVVMPRDVLKALLGNGTRTLNMLILNIRVPRMLVGINTAIALALAGALLQTVSKNELADSSIIGVNAGAATAAVVFISLKTVNYYEELGKLSIYVLPFMAILGAIISSILIYLLSGRDKIRPKRLLLIGIGINSALNAFIIFFNFRGGVSDYNRILTWISGSLWGASLDYAKVIIPIVLLMSSLVLVNHKKLDVLSLSEEHITSLGLNLNNERKKFLLYAAILAGTATAFAGNIGFIGLIAPHLARRLVGPYHKKFMLISAIISIIMLLLADSISRNLFYPIEIPVGITISIIGVPYFIYLIMKEK